MSNFTWKPSVGVTLSRSPKLRTATYGDGYEMNSPKGLNSNLKNWDLTFAKLDKYDADAIMSFLDAAGGYLSFQWLDLDGQLLRYRCADYQRTYEDEDSFSIRAKFMQVVG